MFKYKKLGLVLSAIIVISLINLISADNFGYNNLPAPATVVFDNTTGSVNFSQYADIWITNEGNKDNVADIQLNELSSTVGVTKTFNLGGNTIIWKFTNPVAGFLFNMTGAWSGHAVEIVDNSFGVALPGSDNHLLHVEAKNANSFAVHILHENKSGTALLIDSGIVNLSLSKTIYTENISTEINTYHCFDGDACTHYIYANGTGAGSALIIT